MDPGLRRDDEGVPASAGCGGGVARYAASHRQASESWAAVLAMVARQASALSAGSQTARRDTYRAPLAPGTRSELSVTMLAPKLPSTSESRATRPGLSSPVISMRWVIRADGA